MVGCFMGFSCFLELYTHTGLSRRVRADITFCFIVDESSVDRRFARCASLSIQTILERLSYTLCSYILITMEEDEEEDKIYMCIIYETSRSRLSKIKYNYSRTCIVSLSLSAGTVEAHALQAT